MNLIETAIQATETSVDELVYTLKKTPDEKIVWKPGEVARTALNVAAECVIVTNNWTKIIASGHFPSDAEFQESFSHLDDYANKDQVIAALCEATGAFTCMLRSLKPEDIERELTAPCEPKRQSRHGSST